MQGEVSAPQKPDRLSHLWGMRSRGQNGSIEGRSLAGEIWEKDQIG